MKPTFAVLYELNGVLNQPMLNLCTVDELIDIALYNQKLSQHRNKSRPRPSHELNYKNNKQTRVLSRIERCLTLGNLHLSFMD